MTNEERYGMTNEKSYGLTNGERCRLTGCGGFAICANPHLGFAPVGHPIFRLREKFGASGWLAGSLGPFRTIEG